LLLHLDPNEYGTARTHGLLLDRVIPCLLLAMLGVLAALPSNAQSPGESGILFDIPAQSLTSALEIYGETSSWEVLYNTNLATGHRSGAVQGRFTPEAALQRLLTGTSLVARYTNVKSVVLVPVPPTLAAQAPVNLPLSATSRQSYYGRIQERLTQALCRDGSAQPGHYRVAAQIWIGTDGSVVRSQRLSSTGRPQADSGIDQTLRNLRIGAPLPAGFAQPVTVVVVPQTPDVTLNCDSDRIRLGATP
jgi:hypothetical protein